MKTLTRILIPLIPVAIYLSAGAQETTIYIHTAEESNISLHTSAINNEQLDSVVNYYPVFTHNFNPGGGAGVYQPNHIGLYYASEKWRFYDEDKNDFIKNTNYNILIPGIGSGSYAHTTSVDNNVNNYSLIDHPKLNNDPSAQIYVSHMFNPGGGSGTYHSHNVGLFYNTSEDKWAIYNEDQAAMEKDISFNLVFIPSNSSVKTFVHTVDGGNLDGHITVLDHPSLNSNPNAKIIVNHVYNPGGTLFGKYNDHPIGVFYNGTKWAIYNEDKADLDLGLGFNVMIVNDPPTAQTAKLMEIPSLRIGPNPVEQGQAITIGMFNEFGEDIHIEVIDIQGKLIMEKNLLNTTVVVEQISTVNLPKGLYLVKVNGKHYNAVRRILIE